VGIVNEQAERCARVTVGPGEREASRGTGDEGRELLHELDRLEEEMGSAITPHGLEFDEDASVGTELDAVLGERGAEEVAAELFEAGAIIRGHPDVGVEVEAVELGLAGTARGGMAQVRLVAEAVDAGASARGPRATRPWTEAPARPARTGEASVNGSAGALSSSGSSWRRVSSRPIRARTVARTCATSSSLGGAAR
jgi:hypothetical protein